MSRIRARHFLLFLVGLLLPAIALAVESAPPRHDERHLAPYLALRDRQLAFRDDGPREEPSPDQAYYDVGYYDLGLSLEPELGELQGEVRVVARVTSDTLDHVLLDLDDFLDVAAVSSHGTPVAFTRPSRQLRVALEHTYALGDTIDLLVSYSGDPSEGGSFFWDSFAGRDLVWTLSQPFGARSWWPCKDFPEDKPDSVDIRVTVPSGLFAASNGTLLESSDNDTVATFHWRERHPIASYLVSLAVHNYTETTDWYVPSPTDSVALVFYDIPEHAAAHATVQGKVKDMMAAFAARFGAYPFANEKYGHAEIPIGGGMEHQTLASLGSYDEGVIAHELGHQWFGDRITCDTYHDVWLNEGFATYSEALWEEAKGGSSAYLADMMQNQFFGPGTIYVDDLSDYDRIFDGNLSYNKGSWVLHMLRHVMGNANFWALLHQWPTSQPDGTGTTAQFKELAESISGLELDPFFNEWIYGEGAPMYAFEWTTLSRGSGGYQVELSIDQVQNGQVFTMPIDVEVTTDFGVEHFVVQNNAASQSFTLTTVGVPASVELDKDHWILRRVFPPIGTPTFDKSTLLVNGVSWETYGLTIRNAYSAKAFWGNLDIDFWDYFPTPAGGYPMTLPTPLGHGIPDAATMGQYRNIIWVGNNFGGDLDAWLQSPVLSYMRAGGNLLLMTRLGEDFLLDPYLHQLNIDITSITTITDCVASTPGLTNISTIGVQNAVAVFSLPVGGSSTLLYRAVNGFSPNVGLGVVGGPPSAPLYVANGGKFAFLSGRPYYWNFGQLATNVEYIVNNIFGEGTVDAPEAGLATTLLLERPAPNPFTVSSALSFSLPTASPAELRVYDLSGRVVRSLVRERLDAGAHRVIWDGRDDLGHEVASGIYFLRLDAVGETRRTRLLRMR